MSAWVVKGNAANFVGSSYLGIKQGMNGGEIIIDGHAEDYLGCFMRRGLIIVKGKVGNFCCFKMIAGNVILFKSYKSFLGLSMKRGTIFLMSHDIKNIGNEEMIVMLWANEIFDKNNPDTFIFEL